jgi:hypothetical protein
MKSFVHALLGLAVASSLAAAACGPAPEPSVPGVPSASASPSAAPALPSATPSAKPSASTDPVKPPAGPIVMKPVVATAMTAELQAIGLDPKKLPPIEKLEPEKLRKVMKTFTKSLGVQCNACHNADDFKASTPNKKVASRMWNEFARGLAMADGSAVYCDSCHQGRMHTLDKSDKKALSGWMQAEMVDKLKRTDGKEHGCETCHGDPFEGQFIDKVWAKK